MLDKLMFMLWASWQSHTATIGCIVAGKSFYEALGLMMAGSSVGVILPFMAVEIVNLFVKFIKWLVQISKNRIISLLGLQVWSIPPINDSRMWHQEAVEWVAHHRKSKAIIISLVVIPIPGSEYVAIAASRYTKMENAFSIIFTANIIRTLLIVMIEYAMISNI